MDRYITVVRSLEQHQGRVAMLSVTAPGVEGGLPWGCESEHHHDGRIGCRVDREAADRWNESAPWRWAALWRRVSGRLKVEGSVLLAKVWEPQARGVAHLHTIVPLHLRGRVVELLREHAADYGFGFIDDGSRGRRRLRAGATGGDAGRYVASYIGDGGKVAGVLEAVREGVIPARTFYVANELSRISGCTMRSLRLRRRAWAWLAGLCPAPQWADSDEWAEVVVEVASERLSRGPPATEGVRVGSS